MKEWEKHLINVLVSKNIGDIINLQEEAIFSYTGIYKDSKNGSFNYSFINFLTKLGIVELTIEDTQYKKIKDIPKGITYKKLRNLFGETSWMSWFIDTDTYFDKE